MSDSAAITVPFETYLRSFSVSREQRNEQGIDATNTRIGCRTLGIYGGSYHIPENRYLEFLKTYYQEVFEKGNPEYLTEKQLETGVIAVDLDFRYDLSVKTRQHSDDIINDIVLAYLDELKSIFKLEHGVTFPVYAFEKPNVNSIPEKNLTKDGIHLLIGIQADRATQILLRKKVMIVLDRDIQTLPLRNSWSDVLDEVISKGHVNWQLIGSSKPAHECYKLTKIYKCVFDGADREFELRPEQIPQQIPFELFQQLSVRYSGHIRLPFTDRFQPIWYEQKTADQRKRNRVLDTEPTIGPPSDEDLSGSVEARPNIPQTLLADRWDNRSCISIRTIEQLQEKLDTFMEVLGTTFHELRETVEYTFILPSKYFDPRDAWIKTGWALRNTDNALFIIWVAFSSKSEKFRFTDIPTLYDTWTDMIFDPTRGLTRKSIYHWAKTDALPEQFNAVRQQNITLRIEQTLAGGEVPGGGTSKIQTSPGGTDYDIATVLHNMFKDEFVCASIKGNLWYFYRNHRWEAMDSGTYLRNAISSKLRNEYRKFQLEVGSQFIANPDTDDDRAKNTKLTARFMRICDMVAKLGKTKDKDNIMKEAKELFYDWNFMRKLDTNEYLMCYNNGVIDFSKNIFRAGLPDDYISKTTNIDYIPLEMGMSRFSRANNVRAMSASASASPHFENAAMANIVEEIEEFMDKLFPIAELREYMWQHLSSTLIGTCANQTFNMYVGIGQNGKSVLANLMETILGDYKGDLPLTVITQQRVKVGGLSPELVALKGIRYAVMQEPSKNDSINEGIMKQLTSGIDPIQARALYGDIMSFIPQFKLVVCSNELMVIKSNDHGTWRRIRICDFLSLFTENPVNDDPDKPYQFLIDKSLTEKFKFWKEPYMALLVERAFVHRGIVEDCDQVLQSSKKYRVSQDYLSEYCGDRIITQENGSITKRELTLDFRNWYTTSYGKSVPNIREVTSFLDKTFVKMNKTTQSWQGICVRSETNDEVEDNQFP